MTDRSELRAWLARMVLAALWAAALPWAGAVAAQSGVAQGVVVPIAGPVRVDAVEVELVSDRTAVVPGEPMRVGLRIRHDPQWHTYWRNPGDSGLPTQVVLRLPHGFDAGPIEWPAPQRLFIPPLANYGYEGEIVLPMVLTVPSNVDGDPLRITGKASWLMCREVCIPGEADVALDLPVQRDAAAGRSALRSRFAALFDEAARRTPQETIAAFAMADGDRLSIGLPGRPSAVEFFPYREGLLRNADEQVLYATDSGAVGARLVLRLSEEGVRQVQRGGDALLEAAEGIAVIDGQVRELAVRVATNTWPSGVEISRVAGAPATLATGATRGLDLPGLDLPGLGSGRIGGTVFGASSSSATGTLPSVSGAGSVRLGSLWIAALFGAIGGLILNLMPCVFPVVGLKVLGFARYNGQAEASSRLGAIAFTVGVVVSFWSLAAFLLALRAAGETAGWGFQLQSPVFVAAMAMLFVAIGLNFAGVYEIGTSMTRLGQHEVGDRHRHPLLGSFASGVLAVLVATPCTAPFMGSALGFTLGSSASEALVVFTAIALGMSLPYLLLGFFPGWLRWLPRPGRWMETFRQLLAFPMYATAAWLAWVLGRQSGIDAVFALAIGAVLFGLAAWLYGRFVQYGVRGASRSTGASRSLAATLAAAAFVSGLWTALPDSAERGAGVNAADDGASAAAADASGWQAWSSERVSQAREAGRPVFVDFTAAWCVSCQVNKQLVLEREAIASAMSQRGVLRLHADWTRRDPAITAELARFGRNGVPLYLLYRPGESEPQILPELLTPGIVMDALSRIPPAAAAAPPASSAGL